MKYINNDSVLIRNTGYLVLVRHGQSMGNAWSRAYHNPEMNFLTELGETQAKMAGLKLAETNISFDAMITSSMVRARHTLSILAHTIGDWQRDFIIDDRFNERISPLAAKGPLERESLPHEHKERVDAGLADVLVLLEQKQNVLLVSHYYTMQVLFNLLGVDRSRLWGNGEHIPNAVPYIWDQDDPNRMIVLNDETRVPHY